MIRIEVSDSRGQIIQSKDFTKDSMTCGRSIESDIIIPDFKLKLCELKINRVENHYQISHLDKLSTLAGEHFIRLPGYKIRVIDLNYFQGEPKLSPEEKSWTFSIILLFMAITFLSLNKFIERPDQQIQDYFLQIAGQLLSILTSSLLLSLFSRSINGEYRVVQICNRILIALIGGILLTENLYGARWLLPQFFWNHSIWSFIYFLFSSTVIWSLSNFVFEHVSAKIRNSILAISLTLICVLLYTPLLPFKDRYDYPRITPAPPLLNLFEDREINKDQFMEKLKSVF